MAFQGRRAAYSLVFRTATGLEAHRTATGLEAHRTATG